MCILKQKNRTIQIEYFIKISEQPMYKFIPNIIFTISIEYLFWECIELLYDYAWGETGNHE